MSRAMITMWDSLTKTTGHFKLMDWDVLFHHLSTPVLFAGTLQHPGWSASTFEPCERKLENVKLVSALVLDYDYGETIAEARERWMGYYGFLHTTRKHKPNAPRFRVILPFLRPVSPEEYTVIWDIMSAIAGSKIDQAPKDPSRFWYTPGTPDPDHFEAITLDGGWLDPDKVLDAATSKAVQPEPSTAATPRKTYEPASAEKRAAAYLAHMPAAIAGCRGHDALWDAALAMVAGFGLDEESAFILLANEYNPRCQPPWTPKELRHKVQDAANKSKLPRGYKLDEQRDWAPAGRQQTASTGKGAAPPPPEPKTAEPSPADACAMYGVKTVGEILKAVYMRASQLRPEKGCPTGIKLLDRLIGGYRSGMITVVGAQTSWGKSSFAIMAFEASLKAGKRVLLITGEDTDTTYGNRIMARRSGVNAMNIRDCACKPADLGRMAAVLGSAEDEPFFLNGIGKPAEYLATAIQSLAGQLRPDLIIIDYLQAFKCQKRCQDRRTEVTHITQEFSHAIKNSDCAGLMFSQLKRIEDGARPTMADIKESGDVENMAEHVLIGYRVTPKTGKSGKGASAAEPQRQRFLVIEKNKDGPVHEDPIEIPFDAVTASFRETREEDPPRWENSYE